METLVSGRITRDGSCLYLEHSPGHLSLILWADEDVQVATLDETDWLVNNYTSGLRIREGEIVRGGGGFYPRDADLMALTGDEVPADCAGPAVQLYNISKYDSAKPDRIPDPLPPQPPGPSTDDMLLSQAFDERWDGQRLPRRTIKGIADPREAMFTYVLQDYKGRERNMRSHFCLRGADEHLLASLSRQFGLLFPGDACSWNGPGVVVTATGEKAMFIDARIDCSGAREFCAGSGGATYGNLGAEHGAYRLRRKGDGWQIEKLGLGVIS
ncbi:hypothetical protein [Erythrobacter aureus]|uniref:hypothetical protein n=1 Tax=Erythrobacter aureus TaxID=2182384 RepID=UPI003A91F23C